MNAATTPDAGHRDTASTTATPQKSGLPGWLRLVVSALAFVLALIALILIRNATSEVGTQNTRNFHFVDIAAKGLETWPQSIQTMVRNQYLLNKTDNQSVALYHPQIGSYIVHFFSPIPNEKKCRSADGRKLDNYQLAVSFDESIHPGQGVRVVVSGGVYLHPEVNIPGRPDAPLQCFMVRVPLDRLITTATAGTATPVSHILIVDEAGAVLAQSGEPVLPLNRIDQLDPTDTLSKNMIAQVLPGKSSADKSDKPATRSGDNGDRGADRANAAITPAMTRDVMALHSRGEDYLAYVKPFQISGSLQQPYSSGQDNQAARSAAATASASATYYIVGLIPRADLTRDWITSMPVLRTATLLGLLALLMLLPTLHFLLIGGTESISRADVIGIILGVPTALGLALMLLLFLFDLGANRTEAKRELAATSTSLATNTGAELQKRLANLAAIVTSNAPVPVPSTDPFMLGVAVNDTGESPDMTPRAVTTQPEAKKRIQQQEIYDKPDGIKDRFVVAVDASGRDYFQILRDKGGDHLEISPASVVYTLGLEHSQTNGFDLGVIAMRPDNKETCGDPAGPKPVRNCRIAAFPIASLIAPLLPDPTHFLVIDTTNWAGNTAHLPIIAQDERGVASRENLLDDADLADEVINQLTDLGRRTDTRCANHPLAGQVDRTPFQFSGRYAGRNTLFAAQRIACSHWVAITWQDRATIDTRAAQTAISTLQGTAAFGGLLVMTILALSLALVFCRNFVGILWKAERGWLRGLGDSLARLDWALLWPHESESGRQYYAVTGTCLIALLASEIGVLILHTLDWHRTLQVLAILPGIALLFWRLEKLKAPEPVFTKLPMLITLVSIVLAVLCIAYGNYLPVTFLNVFAGGLLVPFGLSQVEDSEKPLQAETERAYRILTVAMIVAVAISPIMFLWSDAHRTFRIIHAEQRFDQASQDLHFRQQLFQRICQSNAPKPPGQNSPKPPEPMPPGLLVCDPATASDYAPLPGRLVTQTELPDANFAGQVWTFLHQTSLPPVVTVDQSAIAGGFLYLEHTAAASWAVVAVARGEDAWPSWRIVTMLIILGLVPLVVLLWWLPGRLLDTLTGFGIPLGSTATDQPLPLDKADGHHQAPEIAALPARLLVVTGGHRHRDSYREWASGQKFRIRNLTDFLLPLADKDLLPVRTARLAREFLKDVDENDTLVIDGLTLLLHDTARRRAALTLLDRLDRMHLRTATTPAEATPALGRIIILSETTPLERILDVFDSDLTQPHDALTNREELRWARLFERYTTVSDNPPQLKDREPLALAIRKVAQAAFSDLAQRATLRFLLELRFVPDYVLATLDKNLPEQIKSTTDQAVLASFSDPNLTTDQHYQRKIEHYEVKIAAIISLAKNKNFSSPAAAISYLRDNFIEHYEQLWFASTQSERLVLDALARGHFINMRKALPLRSLVRQGMVVLDPIPRPFSHSFALFVRQAERPDTIARWRTSQPKGQWESARLAAFLVLPLGLGALALAAVYNGDSLSTVLPALVAGAPALIGMVSRRATSLAQ